MRAVNVLAVFALACGLGLAQEKEADVREHFDLVATRATAIFQSAGSIDERLKDQGATLHPQLAALRMRADVAIRAARAALDKHDLAAAESALKRAEALLDRFASRLGG